jgi:membrane associated rhomboid family serine protease
MGIYDREYYRKEGPSYLDALIPSGQVCKWLIGINILVFILQLVTKPSMQELQNAPVFQNVEGVQPSEVMAQVQRSFWGPVSDSLMLDSEKVNHGQVWRLLTYSFLHSPFSWTHIFFNMLFLWWFGSEIEEMYGSKEFLAFYLLSAVVGGLAFQVQALAQAKEMFCVGASGAVTALLVLYAFHFPHATILLFFFVPVPIWLLVIFEVGQDAFQLLGGTHTSIAVSVHLGGAAFAALYYNFQWRVTSVWQGVPSWRRQRAKPKLRVYHPEEEVPVAVPSIPAGDLDEHLDAKLDAVLEKLSRYGRESLTESERDILLRASEIYKKKRT